MIGWLYGENVEIDFLAETEGEINETVAGTLYCNLQNKFYNDTVKNKNAFLEGYISNKKELMQECQMLSWQETHAINMEKESFPISYRGSFCGYILNSKRKVFFTDHIGSKPLFYYQSGKLLIVSTKLLWIVQVLKHNNICYTFDETAAKYMLTYGFMLDDTTFVKEVKRILPGNKVIIDGDFINAEQYYTPTINAVCSMSEEQALELIDKTFRKAVQREFEKDREYGYKHLVDLSGGLDSRMVTWVAHDLGYTEQTNFSYCKAGYLDYISASRIARDLQHEFYFNQLDDFQWIYDIDEIVRINNGEALYNGITGGKRCLHNLNCNLYGIEHTGMIGDVIISSFASDVESAYKKPNFGKNQYSTMLKYDFSVQILDRYENQEIFDLCTRGMLGAMSSYAIRQNYLDVSSPFLDVDFMDACFSMPLQYRCNHKIYLKWMRKYYPKSTNYGWEKWAGVCPKEEYKLLTLIVFAIRKIKRFMGRVLGKEISDYMSPLDYWYNNDKSVQNFLIGYYENNIHASYLSEELRMDMKMLFEKGNVNEKCQVLTVLGICKNYFESI